MTCDEICELFSRFKQECPIETYGLPFEVMLTIEEQLITALLSIPSLTERESTKVQESVDLHFSVLLNQFARRMASATVSLNDDALIRCALTAISLDRDLLDERDVYRTGALILDCCRRRGLTPKSLYSNYLTTATENRKAMLMRQLSTAPDYMRSLRAMKFGVVQSDGEFKYIDQMFESPGSH